MVAGKSPDWLPTGWTEEAKVTNGRRVKYYTNTETGQKFYSQKDVLHYVEMGKLGRDRPQQESKQNEGSSEPMLQQESKQNDGSLEAMPLAMKTTETPEWLPHGWTMEVKAAITGSQMGRKYKCYIDTSTGRKFYSKPQVTEYLKTNSCASQQEKVGDGSVTNPSTGELTEGISSPKLERSQNMKTLAGTSRISKRKKKGRKNFAKNFVIEKAPADGLPPGWIKEIKIEKKSNGIRRDPYYTDPVSGYVFRSQKDAARYLETGEIDTCAIKPKKRAELPFLNEETSEQRKEQ